MSISSILFLVKKNFPLSPRRKQSRPKNKKKQGSRPLLGAILGIALSLIPLTVVIHISEGMIRGITDRSIETYLYHFQLFSYNEEKIDGMSDLAKKIQKSHNNILLTHVESEGFGLIYNDNSRMGTTIRAIPEDLYQSDEGFARYIEIKEGSFDLSGSRSILLGMAVAEDLDASVGDTVKLISARILEDGTIIPKILQFTVTGIFSTGYQELDKLWTFIPFETGKILLSPENSKSFIAVKISDPYNDLANMKDFLYDETEGMWDIFDWKDQSYSQQATLRTTKALLVVIMVVLVFVAVINVSSSLTMVVLEQQQTIGILKCTGTSPGTITGLYLIIGTIAGVAGALLGLTTGTLLSVFINQIISGLEFLINEGYTLLRLIISGLIPLPEESFKLINTAYYLDKLPVKTEWIPLIISAIATVFLSIIFSVYPAVKAGKIRPLDVIRKF